MNLLIAFWLALAAFAAARFARAFMRGLADRLLIFATAFVAQIVLAHHVLGLVELAVGTPPPPILIVGAGLALGLAVEWGARRMPASSAAARHVSISQRLSPAAKAGAIAFAGGLLVLSLLLAFGFPRGFEPRHYHLIAAAQIWRDHSLLPLDRSYFNAYPVNMSVWVSLWQRYLPERFVSLAALPFLCLFTLGACRIARIAGAQRGMALLAAFGAATIPIVGFGALEIAADVPALAFVAVAYALAITSVIRQDTRPAILAVAGLALGLAFGFKSLHLVSAAVLGLAILFWPGRPFASRVAGAGGFTTAFLLVAGYWLLRNALLFENPLYPVFIPGLFDALGLAAAPDIALIGRDETQFVWVRSVGEWARYPWTEWNNLGNHFQAGGGTGPFFAFAAVAALFFWPLFALFSPRHTPVWQAQALLWSGALFILLLWWLLGDRQPRYLLAVAALLPPLFAAIASQARARLVRTAEWAMVGCLAVNLVILTVQLAEENVPLALASDADRAMILEYPAAIDRLDHAVVANLVDGPENYALLGKGYRNRVIDTGASKRAFAHAGDTRSDSYVITTGALRDVGATHIYAAAGTDLRAGPGVRLSKVDRIEANPFNGRPLPHPRILYRAEAERP